MSQNTEIILDQIDVVKLDINLWTSSKKLRPEDLVLANGSKLPPEDLAYLGTKKTVDPERLKEFNRIKKEAERICLQSGTRFIGGFANPRSEIHRIMQELDSLSMLFTEARRQFLLSYDQDTEAWIARHAEFGDAIRRAIEPVSSVANKLRFDYVIFRVTKSDSAEEDESLTRRTLSMSDQLFHEIAQDASQLIDRSFVGKDTVTGRTLSAFRRMRDKLDNLGFLDHRCMPVVDKIDAVLVALPKQGPYNGVAFNSLFSLGQLLSDPDKIKRHGSGLLQLSSNPPEPLELVDAADVQIDSTIDAVVPDQANFQLSLPEAVSVLEDSVLGAQPEEHSELDDDLPGFDDFLSNYDETLIQNTEAEAAPLAAISDTSIQSDPAAGFMEDMLENVKTAVAKTAEVIPIHSENHDQARQADLGHEEVETEAETETVGDYWF